MEELQYPNNIAIIRKIRGFSQAYIAEQIGVSRPKYIEIEKGLKELTVSQVKKLQELLDVEFDDLLGIDTGNIDIRKFIKKDTPSQEPTHPKSNSIKLFEDKTIRSVWDEKEEKWWFSVADVVAALTNSADPKQYIKKMRQRDPELNKGWVQFVPLLPIQTAGGVQRISCSDTKGILRIIQSIPSKKAEPFKRWLAQVGSDRIDQMADPEKSIQQALQDHKRLGYSDNWINQRLKSIEIRKDLTDTWGDHGVKGQQYATLTDIIYQTWAGKTAKEYKKFKGLKKENLRDNMTNGELLMNMLAEYSTTSITKSKNPQTFKENTDCAIEDGNIAKLAKEQLESKTGKKIVSNQNAKEIRTQKLIK